MSLFLLKVSAGVLLGWITHQFFPNNDYWILHEHGLYEYDLLVNHKSEFFTNVFHSPYDNGYTGYFNAVGSYWNDLSHNLILKILAFLNVLSRGNFYINSIFLNCIGFFGHIALFRVFTSVYRDKKRAILIGCFLLPSTLYFSSGVGKDLFVFTMLGIYCYCLFFSLTERFTVRRSFIMLISFIVILLMRNFVAVSLIPLTIGYAIVVKRRLNPLSVFAGICASIIVLLLINEWLLPSFQPLKVITQRQTDFLNIPHEAATSLPVNLLEPNLKSFIVNIPAAINHGFLRPYLWDAAKKTVLLPLAIELAVYEFILLLVVSRLRKKNNLVHPFTCFALFFSVSMLLLTGYIIPYTGAIVRYRSIYLPFLLTPLLVLFENKYLKRKHIIL